MNGTNHTYFCLPSRSWSLYTDPFATVKENVVNIKARRITNSCNSPLEGRCLSLVCRIIDRAHLNSEDETTERWGIRQQETSCERPTNSGARATDATTPVLRETATWNASVAHETLLRITISTYKHRLSILIRKGNLLQHYYVILASFIALTLLVESLTCSTCYRSSQKIICKECPRNRP